MALNNEDKKLNEALVDDMFDDVQQEVSSGGAMALKINKKENSMAKRKWQDFGFLASIFIWPTIVIIITYFYLNLNFILLAFQEYVPHVLGPNEDPANVYLLATFRLLPFDRFFQNFSIAWTRLEGQMNVGIVARNSLLNYFVGLFLITPMQIFVSFAIYKKIKCVNVFIVILYLPQVIAGMVWVIIYKQMLSYALPAITGNSYIAALFTGELLGAGIPTLILMWVYVAWTNMGGAMMIITGMFARIEHEIVEAAQIDGCNLWKEFWHISFPHYWPVFSISIFTGVAGIFTDQSLLYSFFAASAPEDAWTFGYYFFKLVVSGYSESRAYYPEAAAAGLIMTAIVVPIVLTTKHIVQKADKMEGSV